MPLCPDRPSKILLVPGVDPVLLPHPSFGLSVFFLSFFLTQGTLSEDPLGSSFEDSPELCSKRPRESVRVPLLARKKGRLAAHKRILQPKSSHSQTCLGRLCQCARDSERLPVRSRRKVASRERSPVE